MTQEQIEELAAIYGDLISIEGYNEYIVGVTTRNGAKPSLCYDRCRILAHLRDECGMEADEAVDHFERCIMSFDSGEMNPSFIDLAEVLNG